MSKNIVIAIIVLIVLVVLVLLFTGGKKEPVVIEPTPAPDNGQVINTTGVVSYIDLEGGFFGILGDDGAKYLPVNLTEDFQDDGLMVRFLGQAVEDYAGIHMWGLPVEILEISLVVEAELEPEVEVEAIE